MRHIEQIKRKLGIDNILTDVSSWKTEGGQIDLVIERADHVINLCEMKYSDEPYVVTKSYFAAMDARRALFKQATRTGKALHLTIVTPLGIKANTHSGNIQSVVTLDDLFREV